MTYTALDALFVVAAALVLTVAIVRSDDRARLVRRWWPAITIAGMILIVLTAVFDGLMIGSGLMSYGHSTTSGVRIGLVPVEDFAYPIGGLLLLPGVWLLTRRRTG